MLESAAQRYKEVRVTTASPGELLLALYDGLFRFLTGAKLCMEKDEAPRARELISKAHAILSELYIALDHDTAPELCSNLESIYGFAMERLTYANLKTDPEGIADAIRVLTPLREAWQEAVPRATREMVNTLSRAG